jgi:dihydroorotase
MPYDLMLRGGHVIDPRNGIDAVMDVAIEDGKIAAVGPDLPVSGADSVGEIPPSPPLQRGSQKESGEQSGAPRAADVSGFYVTPGLIDLHVHSYGYRAWTFPDEYAFPNGVTTVVDAGGSGFRSFEDFKSTIIDRSRVRLLALLNIVGSGMLGPVEQDPTEMQPRPCAEVVRAFPDVIVGVKAAHYGGPGWDSVDGAVTAAELSGTVAMIDYHDHPDRSYRELIMEHLRPGDMHTHMYGQQHAQIDGDGRVRDYVWEARKRGVRFDVGHGAGSFWFRVAIPCMEQGHTPDTISTDVHKSSFFIPRATMPITMSKLMNMGMSLKDAVEKSTSAPADTIGRGELGSLTVGGPADVAVFELEEGDFGFVDSGRARMRGTRRLQCHMTVMDGEVVWDLNGLSRPDWGTQGDYVRLP